VREELGPELQALVDLRQRFGVVVRQAYALPPFRGRVRALYRAREEVQAPCVRGGADRRVARVGERAGLAVAEARDVVFVAAECLVLGGFEFEGAFFVVVVLLGRLLSE